MVSRGVVLNQKNVANMINPETTIRRPGADLKDLPAELALAQNWRVPFLV